MKVYFCIYLIVCNVASVRVIFYLVVFGHSNYVCPEKNRVVASQMTEIRSITSLFTTCDQVIGLPDHVISSSR